MGVVYYANYLHWFEQARSQFIREGGMSYAEVEQRGLFLPVREAWCRYRKPAAFDQEIAVRVGISKWGRASLAFAYEVLDLEKTLLLAVGSTEHACVSREGRPVAVPDWLKSIILK